MVEELSITELDMVSGGAANSVNWGDVITGSGYLAVSGGLMYLAIDSFGATLPGAAASFSVHGQKSIILISRQLIDYAFPFCRPSG